MADPIISKIVSGGQTGVDQAALDVAIYLDIPHGGWCPAGRRSESGKIPAVYQLRETPEREYSIRTELNVRESDGTLLLFYQKLSGGTELTRRLTIKHKRPRICFDLSDEENNLDHFREFHQWINSENIDVLNIAGPRASNCQGIGRMAEAFLVQAFAFDHA